MRTNGEGIQENLGNEKLDAGVGQVAAQNQAKCVEPRRDPKEIFLRRLDYAEDTLIRHLAAIRDFRRTLNWAGNSETFLVLEKLLEVEQFIQRL